MRLLDKKVITLILIGSLTLVLTMFKSGLPTQWGIGFWGANGHDAIWHLSLSGSLVNGTLAMPVFSGSSLQNYHIGFDLLLAFLTKLGIPPLASYFQILPIIFSISIGVLTYNFVLNWKKSKQTAFWSTFFVYFGGSFGWIVTLIRGQGVGGESMFWSQQSVSTLINPPFAMSLIILLLGLIFLQRLAASRSFKYMFLAILLFGTLIEVKAYAGVLVLGSLALVSAYKIFKDKSFVNNSYILILLFSSLLSIFFLKFLIPTNGGLFHFSPGWFLETLLSISDRFYWPKLYSAIFNWRSGHIYIKAGVGYLVALSIFILGNFGTRLISVFQKRQIDEFDLLLGGIAIGGIAAPMLFVQEGTAWNTIQFFYYSLFIVSLYAGASIELLLKKVKNKNYKVVFCTTIVLLTIPTTISTLLTVYLPPRPPAVVPYEELEALSFLKKLPEGVVLTFPYDKFKALEAEVNPPRPLYLYDSTAYVSAFSGQQVFLEDEVNLTILGYKWGERRNLVENFYKSLDQEYVRKFLADNNIKYIYWVKPQRATLGETQLGIENIFENKSIIIYKAHN